MSHAPPNDNPFAHWVNLAQTRLGGRVVAATDEWFGPCERLLNPEPAVFVRGRFDDHGKWMDGWETRRRRGLGHDHCVIRLGLAGVVHGVDLDTSHFTGNFPPAASLDACYVATGDPQETTPWVQLLPPVDLNADRHHYHRIVDGGVYSHLRLSLYPDGGMARLRVYGEPWHDWAGHEPAELVDLLAVEHGGRAITCNDQHFGSILNLNLPGRGIDMGDGWETRRRREPGFDWALLALGHPGVIRAIEVDTAHFKGNYPDRCSLNAAQFDGGSEASLVTQSMFWRELLPPKKLEMDRVHHFAKEVQDLGPVSHVRFNIMPDGGVSRLRLLGHVVRPPYQ